MSSFLFSPPSIDDLIRLLKAWRFWTLGALVGALIGAAIFYVSPPPYSARATVLVDFNLEEAWPQEADRQQFFYLEREARKLEDIALSDDVMQAVADSDGMTTGNELRDKKLKLSQPAEGGWHFYAYDYETRRAQRLASEWALMFAEKVKENVANSAGLNSFIQVDATQIENLPVERSVSLSSYLFAGAISFLFLSSLFVLFFSLPSTLSQKERE